MIIKKIKVNIPDFGKRYCSNNVEYKISSYGHYYIFYKKGTDIQHNEYGTTCEYKNGHYKYIINHKYHRLGDYAFYSPVTKDKSYDVIGKDLGNTKEKFIKKLSNVLIPKDRYWLLKLKRVLLVLAKDFVLIMLNIR